jgi:hypothetical protein
MLCIQCQSIEFKTINPKLERFEYAHHDSLSALEASSRDCRLCSMIFYGLCFGRNECNNLGPDDETWLDKHRNDTRSVILFLDGNTSDDKLAPDQSQIVVYLSGDRRAHRLNRPDKREAYFSLTSLDST